MKIKWFILGALAAAALQTAALGKIIYDRATLISNGKEVVLQSGMVDPRDLFRGHYVTLNLTISRIEAKDVKLEGDFEGVSTVYVSLKKGEDLFWIPDAIYAQKPTGIEQPFIRGSSHNISPSLRSVNDSYMLQFPIDRFFAEKGRAKDLEKVRNDRNLGVVVALDGEGGAAIKGISVEGELIYNEPVW